jgi:hypothetical protein
VSAPVVLSRELPGDGDELGEEFFFAIPGKP